MTRRPTFASRLRAARARKLYTQATLEAYAGLSASLVSQFESGRRMPNMKNLIALADALGCSTDYLCGRTPR